MRGSSYWLKCAAMAALSVLALVGTATSASAQEAGDVGLAVGSDGSVGIIWHATNAIAVLPAIQFRHVSIETEGLVSGNEDSTSALLFEVTVPLYLKKRDSLYVFVAPRISHSFQSEDDELPASLSVDRSNIQVAGLVGLQYAISERFSVVGTTGIAWGHSSSEYQAAVGLGTSATIKSTLNTTGSTSRLGVVVYF
jgi:hypothetical protein